MADQVGALPISAFDLGLQEEPSTLNSRVCFSSSSFLPSALFFFAVP